MEFWGVEVPSGKPLTCDPGEESYVHISQAALGENRSGKGNDRVILKVKVGKTEVIVGTLSQGRCDQTPLDLIFDKEFVLFHNSTASSVYFCGYKTDAVKDDEMFSDGEPSESDEEIPHPVQISAKENGKPAVKSETPGAKPVGKAGAQKVEALPLESKSQPVKAKPEVKDKKVEDEEDDEDDDDEDDEDDDEDDDEEDNDEDDEMLEGSSEDDLGSEDEGDFDEEESEEEQPKSAGKKRVLDGFKNTGSGKKPKLSTPVGAVKPGGKTDIKTPSTPAPTSKQQQQSAKKDASVKKSAGKENSSKSGAPSSGQKLGQFTCQPCKKAFQSESALSQHTLAKHK